MKKLLILTLISFIIGFSVGFSVCGHICENRVEKLMKNRKIEYKEVDHTIFIRDSVCNTDTLFITKFDTLIWINDLGFDVIRDTEYVHLQLPIYHVVQDTIYSDSNYDFHFRNYIQGTNLKIDSTLFEIKFKEITQTKNYNLSERISFGLYVGYGIGLINRKFEPQIGLGINYKF